MDMFVEVITTILNQMQKPTLAFLIGGMVLAAVRSDFAIPEQIYKFIVIMLLLKVGIGAGISVREADLAELAVPALMAALLGVVIVLIGMFSLARWKGVTFADGAATAGLFGAVSASTLAAGMVMLDAEGIQYEGFIGALYPFMDLAALLTAIILARLAAERKTAVGNISGGTATVALGGGSGAGGPKIEEGLIKGIVIATFRSTAISALLLGLAIGLLARPESVYESFYEPLFRGFLSLLMLIMGMEAWSRLSELRKVAHAYVLYGLTAPLLHGALGLGAGLVAHHVSGFSGGGVVLLAVMAASSSDISGPPTMRGALPEANPSAYVGTSTGLGTPVAILSIPQWMAIVDMLIGL